MVLHGITPTDSWGVEFNDNSRKEHESLFWKLSMRNGPRRERNLKDNCGKRWLIVAVGHLPHTPETWSSIRGCECAAFSLIELMADGQESALCLVWKRETDISVCNQTFWVWKLRKPQPQLLGHCPTICTCVKTRVHVFTQGARGINCSRTKHHGVGPDVKHPALILCVFVRGLWFTATQNVLETNIRKGKQKCLKLSALHPKPAIKTETQPQIIPAIWAL